MRGEFEKIRDAFKRVRKDMEKLSMMVTESSEEFKKNYTKVLREVEEIKSKLHNFNGSGVVDNYTVEIEGFKNELKDLRKAHEKVYDIINKVSEHDKKIQDLDYRLNSSELEIFLLKERIKEKEKLLERFKEGTKLLLDVVQELAEIEEKLIKNGN